MRKASFTIVGAAFVSMSVVLACSSSTDSTLAGSGTKDGGSSGSSGAVDARLPYPSFHDDVVPIVQASCALTACHSSKQSNLGIFLSYDATQIYGELQKTSPTSMQPFVVAGDPTKSYLMVKLLGQQATLNAQCPNMTCGTSMPPDNALATAQIDTIQKWITAGAKND